MKQLSSLVVAGALAALGAGFASADSGVNMEEMHSAHAQAAHGPEAKAYAGTGTVKRVDKAAGKVSVAHGPIEAIGWPAMTMSFTVKDKKLLDELAPGKKITFQFVQQGSQYVVTGVN